MTCWGDTPYPGPVAGIVDATGIASGTGYSCALLKSGAIMCWGLNLYGELGNGTTTATGQVGPGTPADDQARVPGEVLGIADAVAVAAGDLHACALRKNGLVMCWGHSGFGALGDGALSDSPVPVSVSGLTGAIAIAAGSGFTCALPAGGTVACWGQLGRSISQTPEAVPGIVDATALSAGKTVACALLGGGTVKCWGLNVWGQLGAGADTAEEGPILVSGISDATAIAVGATHACALASSGGVRCWGENEVVSLGMEGQWPAWSRSPCRVSPTRRPWPQASCTHASFALTAASTAGA